MPFSLQLSDRLKAEGWKVKIFDKERLEPPHVTIRRGFRQWRMSLRDGQLMDGGSRHEIDQEVLDAIAANWDLLRREWDAIHGHVNPVRGDEGQAAIEE